MKILFLSVVLSIFAWSVSAQAFAFDHSSWDRLLKKHVVVIDQGVATQVDYGGFVRDRSQLKVYLQALEAVSQVSFDAWSKPEQLAFLINAYNAWTIELVLSAYPELDSIKDLGSWLQSPWGKRFIPLLGQIRSLDDIEHGLIRDEARYQEPLIHFAVNCASVGCPALAAAAYTGETLSDQLNEAARLFLSDRSRNRLQGDTLKVSKLFKWYRDDFERGWGGYKSLVQLFIHYRVALKLTDLGVQRLRSGAIDIEFLDYDWQLNRN